MRENESGSTSSVYITDKENSWIPANVLSRDEGTATVTVSYHPFDSNERKQKTVKLADYPSNILPLQNVNENGILMDMPDMVDLPYLHEPAILFNLKARHEKKMPYTRVGDIVIALNPFQWIGGLYSEEMRHLYSDKLVWNASADGDAKSHVAPHVYETSSLAFRGLACDGLDQSILVSGESGAGKTETVKILMSHMASIQSRDSDTDGATGMNNVVRRVVESNPLLEAFGNAKTVRNDNSSRFGKYTQLQFDVEDRTTAQFSGRAVPHCLLAGSYCDTYLLEKSRVVGHEPAERTYHIFYQLLSASADMKKKWWGAGLSGKGFDDFNYVGNTSTLKIEGQSDAEKCDKTVEILSLIGVNDEKLTTLMRAVCAVLQLGNITFAPDPENSDNSIISSTDELQKLADLMGISLDDLTTALLCRTVVAGKEVYSVPMNASAAKDGCDAFAKEIYQQIFDWLVKVINEATCAESNYEDIKDVEEFGIIGLLDIFGFESFKVNRFEQLTINYANEKLQQKYTLDIFRSVQDEYEMEGIELGDVTFSDNAHVLSLVEGRMGIISVLNEECVRPKGNDVSFVSKIKTLNKDTGCLIVDRLHRPTEFAIEHYAGAVKYDASNFVQKNTDLLPTDLINCACKSSNELINTELKAAADARPNIGGGRKKSIQTVGEKFKAALSVLMANISKTKTRYVRCIKPNPEKEPLKTNLKSSVEQLRCAGVVAAVTVSRVAFPNRLTHETTFERFYCLLQESIDSSMEEEKKESSDSREKVEFLLSKLLKKKEFKNDGGVTVKGFECGKTRVYFRAGSLEHLETERMLALGILASAVQKIVRGFFAKSIFLRVKQTVIETQAKARQTIDRKFFLKCRSAVTTLQCFARCTSAFSSLLRLRSNYAACQIQTRWRTFRSVVMLTQYREATILIQKIARGAYQRPVYKELLKEAEAEAKLNSKLQALQRRLADAEMKWLRAEKEKAIVEKKVAGMVPSEEAITTVEDVEKTTAPPILQQQALIDESGKMLEYLRKEVFSLKTKNYALRAENTELRETNYHLQEHGDTITASFGALKQHTNHLSKTNMKLRVGETSHKKEIAELRKKMNANKFSEMSEVPKLKEEMRKKDALHKAEMDALRADLSKARLEHITEKHATKREYESSLVKQSALTQLNLSVLDQGELWDHTAYAAAGLHKKGGKQKEANSEFSTFKNGNKSKKGKFEKVGQSKNKKANIANRSWSHKVTVAPAPIPHSTSHSSLSSAVVDLPPKPAEKKSLSSLSKARSSKPPKPASKPPQAPLSSSLSKASAGSIPNQKRPSSSFSNAKSKPPSSLSAKSSLAKAKFPLGTSSLSKASSKK
eukprot:CAMPEP_0194358204 /NCGR_PEP_ID=MMETSP0174-20130528/5497_1 /TAXON_ID=216777 /ORGANISM="Proboscia alata, Strain PI-D3" /LENGTH=1339 /DNA_ID=CAMNT_0039128457 /DNA_START=62 /DNA_END=4081 /DNA_ORIENTATION=+